MWSLVESSGVVNPKARILSHICQVVLLNVGSLTKGRQEAWRLHNRAWRLQNRSWKLQNQGLEIPKSRPGGLEPILLKAPKGGHRRLPLFGKAFEEGKSRKGRNLRQEICPTFVKLCCSMWEA